MCDCRADIEAKLLERWKRTHPTLEDYSATLEGYAFVIETDGMKVKPYMPATLTAALPVDRNGKPRTKRMPTNMFFSYCPFCGVKL